MRNPASPAHVRARRVRALGAALVPVTLALHGLPAAPAAAQTERSPGRASEPGRSSEASSQPDASSARPFVTGMEGSRSPRPRRGEPVELSLEDGDLMDLLRMMTRVTGRRFLVSGVQRQIRATIASSAPVSAGEAYQAFLTILHANGLTVVRRGRYHLVVESDDVERQVLPVHDDDDPPRADERFVTWIHRVQHLSASEAAQLLDPLRSPEAHIVTYDRTQTLIVVETGANLRRLRRVLEALDVPRRDAQLWVEPIHHGDAGEIATLLTEILEAEPRGPAPSGRASRAEARRGEAGREATSAAGGAGEPAPLRVLSDARTNALILVTDPPTYTRIIRLLRVLDQPDGERLSVHLHRLQHGDAEAVASTLEGLLGGGASAGAAGARAGRGEGPSAEVQGEVRVRAHADLNAVVVTASRADHRAVAALIEQLDAAPRQVFLEMVLMEVTVDDANSLDADVFTGLASLFGGDVLGLLSSLGTGIDPTGPGTSLSLFGPLITDSRLPDGTAPSFGVQLQALAERTRANILATPHLTALDNREATINIGESVPLQSSAVAGNFLTSALAGDEAAAGQAALNQLSAGGGGGRRDVGTIVTVTPHINDDGEIRMEIRAEDSRQSARSGNLNAATLAQSIAETELVARDGETVVIGGLRRDSEEHQRTGIPILSEIPVLGALFGSTRETRLERNLLFFVTPHVIRRPRDMRAIVERRLRERRELLERTMAFSDDWAPPVDWARTRGLVGEMLTTIDLLEQEAARAATPPPAPPEHVERPPIDAPREEPATGAGAPAVAIDPPERDVPPAP